MCAVDNRGHAQCDPQIKGNDRYALDSFRRAALHLCHYLLYKDLHAHFETSHLDNLCIAKHFGVRANPTARAITGAVSSEYVRSTKQTVRLH